MAWFQISIQLSTFLLAGVIHMLLGFPSILGVAQHCGAFAISQSALLIRTEPPQTLDTDSLRQIEGGRRGGRPPTDPRGDRKMTFEIHKSKCQQKIFPRFVNKAVDTQTETWLQITSLRHFSAVCAIGQCCQIMYTQKTLMWRSRPLKPHNLECCNKSEGVKKWRETKIWTDPFSYLL